MAQLKAAVLTVYNLLAHNSGHVDERSGNHGVTDSNMLHYLAEIEKFVSDFVQNGKAGDVNEIVVEGPSVMACARPFKVIPPSAEEMTDDMLIDEPRPLSHSELLSTAKNSTL